MRKIDRTNVQVATSETTRQINRRIALNILRHHQPMSRADLARRSGPRRADLKVRTTPDSGSAGLQACRVCPAHLLFDLTLDQPEIEIVLTGGGSLALLVSQRRYRIDPRPQSRCDEPRAGTTDGLEGRRAM